MSELSTVEVFQLAEYIVYLDKHDYFLPLSCSKSAIVSFFLAFILSICFCDQKKRDTAEAVSHKGLRVLLAQAHRSEYVVKRVVPMLSDGERGPILD